MNLYNSETYLESGQYTGTSQWYKHQFGIILTDGIKWLRDKLNCYWLVDDIAIFSAKFRKNEDFIVAEFCNDGENRGVLTLSDGNNNVLMRNPYNYTDLCIQTTKPEERFKLWLVYDGNFKNHVLLLPSEY